jgi:hypothetical protein
MISKGRIQKLKDKTPRPSWAVTVIFDKDLSRYVAFSRHEDVRLYKTLKKRLQALGLPINKLI